MTVEIPKSKLELLKGETPAEAAMRFADEQKKTADKAKADAAKAKPPEAPKPEKEKPVVVDDNPKVEEYPEDLHIITDVKDPLYDEREKLPVSEDLMEKIDAFGFLQSKPIEVRMHNGKKAVIEGRQRVKAVRALNAKRKPADRIKVPVVYTGGLLREAYTHTILGNMATQPEDPISNAQKCQRYMTEHNASMDDAANLYKVDKNTIKRWVDCLALDPKVQDKIRDRKFSMQQAVKLKKLTPDEQVKAMKEAMNAETGKVEKNKIKKGIKQKNTGDENADIAPGKRLIQAALVSVDQAASVKDPKNPDDVKDAKLIKQVLAWVLNGDFPTKRIQGIMGIDDE